MARPEIVVQQRRFEPGSLSERFAHKQEAVETARQLAANMEAENWKQVKRARAASNQTGSIDTIRRYGSPLAYGLGLVLSFFLMRALLARWHQTHHS